MTSQRLSVLVADDDPLVQQLAEMMLTSAGYDVRCAANGDDAVMAVLDSPPDILLSDYQMPGTNGMEVCRRVSEAPLERPVYSILMTGERGSELESDGLFAGADDFLQKPFTRKSLVAHVHAGARSVDRVRRLHMASRIDPTTLLPNRRSFDEMLEREWSRSVRYRRPLSCMMIDVDHFKALNDTHGHPAGDQALRWVAETIVRTCRTSELICRYAGDEFVALLPETPIEGARVCADRVVEAVSAKPMLYRGVEMPVTVSVGVAAWCPEMQVSVDLVEAADGELRSAKRGGRNRALSANEVSIGA